MYGFLDVLNKYVFDVKFEGAIEGVFSFIFGFGVIIKLDVFINVWGFFVVVKEWIKFGVDLIKLVLVEWGLMGL